MNAPGSSGPRAHNPEGGPPERETPHRAEPIEPKPWAGSGASLGSADSPVRQDIPSTPGELMAMQQRLSPSQPPEPPCMGQRVAQALTHLQTLGLNAWESQQIALALLQQLEGYHQGVVAELHDTHGSPPAEVACWAIDGDRLMHCRRLLESITLI